MLEDGQDSVVESSGAVDYEEPRQETYQGFGWHLTAWDQPKDSGIGIVR